MNGFGADNRPTMASQAKVALHGIYIARSAGDLNYKWRLKTRENNRPGHSECPPKQMAVTGICGSWHCETSL